MTHDAPGFLGEELSASAPLGCLRSAAAVIRLSAEDAEMAERCARSPRASITRSRFWTDPPPSSAYGRYRFQVMVTSKTRIRKPGL